MITNKGLEFLAKLPLGLADAEFVWFATGTGANEESADDTELGSENTLYGFARKQATVSYSDTGIGTWNVIFSSTGSNYVREYGIFDSSSGGNLLYRKVLDETVPYPNGRAAEFTVNFTFARLVV